MSNSSMERHGWRRRGMVEAAAVAALAAACRPASCSAFELPSVFQPAARSLTRPMVETLGDARIEYLPDELAWVIFTGELEERIELLPYPGTGGIEGPFRLVRRYLRARDRTIRTEIAEDPLDDDQEIPGAGPGMGGILGIDVQGIPEPALVPVSQQVDRSNHELVLTIHLRAAHENLPLDLEAQVRLRPGHSVIEHRSRVHNRGRETLLLTELDSGDFTVFGSPAASWIAASLDTEGHVWVSSLGPQGVLVAEAPPRSAERLPVIPVLALHDTAAGEGIILGLRWSSNYRLLARSLGGGAVEVQAGVRLLGGALTPEGRAVEAALATDPPGLRLRPGATLESPWLLTGFYDGTLDAGANALREYLTATRPRDPAWTKEVLGVAWNPWFAYATGIDYQSMLEEAVLARQIGTEIFYVDHGWARAMGDWVPHPLKFPGNTLVRLADQVHRLGMRFGLWVAFGVAEPESQLLRRHPEFLALQPAPIRLGIDGSLPLCLTRAREWVEAELDRIVREYRLDWLKFDQPMVAACLAEDHGHPPTVRGSLYANNDAFYGILDRLRARTPNLFIESTFDGPGYLDYGVYARSHGVWLDDAAGDPTIPVPYVQRALFGASLGFPARYLTLWLARPPEGFLAEEEAALPPGRSLSPADLAYQAFSTMGGSWGTSLRLTLLDEAQLATLQGLIGIYKQFRDVIPRARIYHLAPTLTPIAPLASGSVVRVAAPSHDTWFVLQYLQPETQVAALLAVRNGPVSAPQLLVRPRDLAPDAVYTVTWHDGEVIGRATGAELMAGGIPLVRPPISGGIVWLAR